MQNRRRPDRAPWLSAAPSIGAFACLAAGFIIARQCASVSASLWFVGAVAAALGACVLRNHIAVAALALGATLFGAGYFQFRTEPHETRARTGLVAERAIVIAEGVLREDPNHAPPNPGAFASFVNLPPVARFTLRADVLEDGSGTRHVHGDLLVRVSETVAHVSAGDRVRISGFFSPIRPPMNPGEPDARRWASQEGVLGRLSASSRDNITRLTPSDGAYDRAMSTWFRIRAGLRRAAAGWLDDATQAAPSDSPGRAALAALLLGDREDASMRDLSQAMQRIGVAHLLSISGLHLGALVGLLVIALRGFGVRGGVEALVIAMVVLLYMTIIPVRTPIVRAGIMALAFLIAEAAGRRYNPLSVLAWTGVLVLLWRPLELWSPGFQLSFGVVGAILALPPRLEARLHPFDLEPDAVTTRRWLARKLEQAVIVAICAWLVAAPLIIHHFGVFSAIGAVMSLALFPFVVLIIGFGAGAILLAALLPTASQALGVVLEWIAEIIARATLGADSAPLSALHLPPVPIWWTISATAIMVFFFAAPRWRWRRDGVLACAVLAVPAFLATPLARPNLEVLRIDTLSVDDGACHVIRSGRDAVLWDAGSRLLWFGERELPRALRSLGAWPIRTIVLSHANLDHYSAIPELVTRFGVRDVVLSQDTLDVADDDPLGPVAHLLDELSRRGVRMRTVAMGDVIRIGDAELTFLHPAPDERWSNRNEGSLVALVCTETHAGVRTALFCGDIERGAMESIRRRFPHLRPHVMEAPHHGSARPFAIQFVESLDPRIVIQSTGLQRAGDDRWDRVRDGRSWLTTATDGGVSVRIHRDGAVRTRTMASPHWREISAESGKSTSTAQ